MQRLLRMLYIVTAYRATHGTSFEGTLMRFPLRLSAALGLAFALAGCSEVLAPPTAPAPAVPLDPHFTVSGYAGQIVINEVMADPSAVLDADGEWLELHNRGTTAVNI
jgi:hypothetical protein